MLETMLITGLAQSLIGGITGYMQSEALSKSQAAQAEQLKANVLDIKAEIERGEIETQEALKRIDTLINNTKGELKGIMEKQVGLASAQIQKQYRTGLQQTMEKLRTEYGQRRLMGEAGTEAGRKTALGMQKQAGEQESDLRERALLLISQQMANLGLKGGMMKEQRITQGQQFRLGALSNIWQLQNQAGILEAESKTDPMLGALAGISGGVPSIFTGIFGKTKQELGTPEKEKKTTKKG